MKPAQKEPQRPLVVYWIVDCVESGPDHTMPVKEALQSFESWCCQQGVPYWETQEFAKTLEATLYRLGGFHKLWRGTHLVQGGRLKPPPPRPAPRQMTKEESDREIDELIGSLK